MNRFFFTLGLFLLLAPVLYAQGGAEAVTAAALPAPNLAQSGLRDEKNGGLNADLFRASRASALTASFTALAQALEEGAVLPPVLRDLALRLSLSRAYEPEADTADALDRLMAARIRLAFAAGGGDEAALFLEKKPAVFAEEDWNRLIQFYFLQARWEGACAVLAAHPPVTATRFAAQAGIACALHKGQMDAARLQLDVLREAKDEDGFFLELAEKALTKKGKLTQKNDRPDAVALVLMAMAQQPLTEAQMAELEKTPVPVLTHLRAPDEWRVAQMHKLATYGTVTRTALESFYDSLKLAEEKTAPLRDNPELLRAGDEKVVPPGMGFFYGLQALAGEASTANKAQILGILAGQLNGAELSGPMGEALQTFMDSVAPLPENESVAPTVARLVLQRGSKDMQSWWRLSTASPVTREQGIVNLPLAILRGFIADAEREEWLTLYLASSYVSAPAKVFNLALLKASGLALPSSVEAVLQQNRAALEGAVQASPLPGQRGEQLLGLVGGEMNAGKVTGLLRLLHLMGQQRLAETLALSMVQY